jgi:hypothetical protein
MKSLLGASDLLHFFLVLNMHFFEPKKSEIETRWAGLTRRVVQC